MPADGIGALRFLVGRWRGTGTLRGRPVTSVSECHVSPSAPDALTLRITTLRDGTPIHEEDIHWMTASGAVGAGGASGVAVRCVTRPRSDEEQIWRMRRPGAAPRWELTRPGYLWTIERTADGYREVFETVAADGARTTVVQLTHVREDGARAGAQAGDA